MGKRTFNIGDKVVINKKYKNRLWYTSKYFSITDIKDYPILRINHFLPHASDIINVEYLVLLKEERKEKLDNINNV